MNLTAIYSALGGIEDKGGEMVAFLKSHIAKMSGDQSEVETKLTSAQETVKAIAASLGVAEAEVLPIVKAYKTKDKEIETLKSLTDAKENEVKGLKEEIGSLKRREDLNKFSSLVGADSEVLLDLLPVDLEFKVADTVIDGKGTKKGMVVQNGKEIPFADYVDSDAKLSKFRASIFPQSANPPSAPLRLPNGKSDGSKDPVLDALTSDRRSKASSVRKLVNG